MENIVERIRKLLAMSRGTANEHEASVAMQRAQEMLAKYNLDIADVEQGSSVDFITDGDLLTESSNPWRRDLGANIARLYFSHYFFKHVRVPKPERKDRKYQRLDRHHFVGLPHNVAISKEMFVYLVDTVERLAKDARKEKRESASYEKSFRHGCGRRLIDRLSDRYWQQKEEPDTVLITHNKTTLPALYDQTEAQLDAFIADKHGELTTPKNRGVIKSETGKIDGWRAGADVGLDTQVTSNTAKHMIGGN